MKLGDFLEIVNESVNINVYVDNLLVSAYDGKNSIDLQYNNKKILKMLYSEKDNLICIDLV